MTTGQYIKQLRLKKGLIQEELAEKAYTSVRTIQRIENDAVKPRGYTLQNIASVLDVDFERLVNHTNTDLRNAGDQDNVWLPLLHLSGLFILLFPPLIIWTWKKDRFESIEKHGVDVINFQLTILLLLIPSGLLAGFLVTVPVVILIGVFSTAVIIVNTVKVINGESYRYPFAIRILKR